MKEQRLHYFYDPGTLQMLKIGRIFTRNNECMLKTFMNNRYGEYPYPVYSFVQGGDGGMEYAMGTLNNR